MYSSFEANNFFFFFFAQFAGRFVLVEEVRVIGRLPIVDVLLSRSRGNFIDIRVWGWNQKRCC